MCNVACTCVALHGLYGHRHKTIHIFGCLSIPGEAHVGYYWWECQYYWGEHSHSLSLWSLGENMGTWPQEKRGERWVCCWFYNIHPCTTTLLTQSKSPLWAHLMAYAESEGKEEFRSRQAAAASLVDSSPERAIKRQQYTASLSSLSMTSTGSSE